MQKFWKTIDALPVRTLVILTIFLGLAPYLPFMTEPPHLFAKLQMLAGGALSKPIDIFDLLLHATPAVLLTLRLVRIYSKRKDARQP